MHIMHIMHMETSNFKKCLLFFCFRWFLRFFQDFQNDFSKNKNIPCLKDVLMQLETLTVSVLHFFRCHIFLLKHIWGLIWHPKTILVTPRVFWWHHLLGTGAFFLVLFESPIKCPDFLTFSACSNLFKLFWSAGDAKRLQLRSGWLQCSMSINVLLSYHGRSGHPIG